MIAPADVLVVASIALATSGTVAGIGALALRRMRTRSTTTSLVGVVLVALLAVTAGAAATANFMFVSAHDLQILLVVVTVTGLVGLATAVLLGRTVAAAGAAVALAAAGLADGDYRSVTQPLPAELADLDQRLSQASVDLRDARAKERATETGRRELVAWISHDLRTPLAGIRAMAEALTDTIVTDTATVQRYHAQIQTEAERLSALVEGLFELSRIHSGALHLTLQDLPLGLLVDDALDSARPLADAAGVNLTGEITDGEPNVQVSPSELDRILSNLLSNAIRHTPAGGTVLVHVHTHPDTAEIVIHDGCGGIPEHDLPRLFDVAFRGTAARTPTAQAGRGLGLAIARGLTEAHHGRLNIDNAPPGCRAVLHLPLRDNNTALAADQGAQ